MPWKLIHEPPTVHKLLTFILFNGKSQHDS
jgi:hypothetical protein